MNADMAGYHVAVNADVHDIQVIFVEQPDDIINPLGFKGLGEIGIVGVAAAIANAVYHATGKRIRDLPITLDKLARSPPAIPYNPRSLPAPGARPFIVPDICTPLFSVLGAPPHARVINPKASAYAPQLR